MFPPRRRFHTQLLRELKQIETRLGGHGDHATLALRATALSFSSGASSGGVGGGGASSGGGADSVSALITANAGYAGFGGGGSGSGYGNESEESAGAGDAHRARLKTKRVEKFDAHAAMAAASAPSDGGAQMPSGKAFKDLATAFAAAAAFGGIMAPKPTAAGAAGGAAGTMGGVRR